MKPQLLISYLKKFDNFQHLKERVTANDYGENKYTSKLFNAFQSRFSEFADQADNIALFTNPFNS